MLDTIKKWALLISAVFTVYYLFLNASKEIYNTFFNKVSTTILNQQADVQLKQDISFLKNENKQRKSTDSILIVKGQHSMDTLVLIYKSMGKLMKQYVVLTTSYTEHLKQSNQLNAVVRLLEMQNAVKSKSWFGIDSLKYDPYK